MKWLKQFFGVCSALVVLSSGQLTTYAGEMDISADVPVAAEVDPIEPGSVESFWYWAEANLEMVNTLATEPGIYGWADATIGYALDMRSLFLAYQAWYDNQTGGTGIPPLHTQVWNCAIKIDDTMTYRPMVITGYYDPYYSDYRLPSSRSFVDLPYGGFVNTWQYWRIPSPSQVANWQQNQTTLVFAYSPASTNWLGSTPRDLTNNNFGIYFCSAAGYSGIGQQDYNNGPPNPTNRAYCYNPKNLDGLGFTYIPGVNTIQDMYQQIVDKYPDADPNIVYVPPPVDDVTFNEEPTEPPSHPGGCQCEVHVVVTVDVNHDDIEFPTYNVEDVSEAPDFDYNWIETLNPEDVEDVTMNPAAIGTDIISGASFWFQLLDAAAEMFNIKGLVITLLGIALVLFFIMR